MKKEYRDRLNRIVCYADGVTGEIWHEYRKVKTKTTVPIGGTFSVEREGVMTILTRTGAPEFDVTSYKIAA